MRHGDKDSDRDYLVMVWWTIVIVVVTGIVIAVCAISLIG